MPKQKIINLGILTLVGFPILGITIIGFVEENPWEFSFNWLHPMSLFAQLSIGLVIGIIAGYVSWWLINRPFLSEIKTKYGLLIHQLHLDIPTLIFLSFCAGVGEEFLFRGVLQTYWGVWITAVIFVAIHGYLDPRDRKMLIYGITMTVFIGILGYLKIYAGLIAPMVAHMVIDIILLYHLSTDKTLKQIQEKAEMHSHLFPEQSVENDIHDN